MAAQSRAAPATSPARLSAGSGSGTGADTRAVGDFTVTTRYGTGSGACPPVLSRVHDEAAHLLVAADRAFRDPGWYTAVRREGLAQARRLLDVAWWSWATARSPEGELVGFAALEPVDHGLRLAKVMVHPRHRRAGVARRLCQDLLTAADSAGLPVTLDVLLCSPGAVRLYDELGFVPCALGQLDQPGFECLVMRRPAKTVQRADHADGR